MTDPYPRLFHLKQEIKWASQYQQLVHSGTILKNLDLTRQKRTKLYVIAIYFGNFLTYKYQL